jgi:hypothetical protein
LSALLYGDDAAAEIKWDQETALTVIAGAAALAACTGQDVNTPHSILASIAFRSRRLRGQLRCPARHPCDAEQAFLSPVRARQPQRWACFYGGGTGISLKPEVLMSNLPGYLPPFWLSPQLVG